MSKKNPKCDWCRKAAKYEHPHVMGRAELACDDHYQDCERCRPIGGSKDKYADKKKKK